MMLALILLACSSEFELRLQGPASGTGSHDSSNLDDAGNGGARIADAPFVAPCDSGAEWCPGDAIPGWDDSVSGWQPPSDAVVVSLPVYSGEIDFGFDAVTDEAPRPIGTDMWFGDCEDPNCGTALGNAWYVSLYGPDSHHAQGWYENDCANNMYDLATWYDFHIDHRLDQRVEQGCAPDPGATFALARAYISRLYPGEIAGFVYFDVPADAAGWDHAAAVYYMPFDILLPAHSGVDVAVTQNRGCADGMTDMQCRVRYDYIAVDYDDAWPWDEITDPTIRDRVYALYTPLPG